MATAPTIVALPRLPKVVTAALMDVPIVSFVPKALIKRIGRCMSASIDITHEHHFKNFSSKGEDGKKS